jgi:hypothetical protein
VDIDGDLDWKSDLLNTFRTLTANNYDSLTELEITKITVTTTHVKSSQFSLAVVW